MLVFLITSFNFIILNCKKQKKKKKIGLFSFTDSNSGSVSITGSQFTSNSGTTGTTVNLVNAAMSVQITSSTFDIITSTSGSVLAAQTRLDNPVFLKDLTLTSVSMTSFGAIYLAGTSTLSLNVPSITIDNVIMRNSTFKTGGLLSTNFVVSPTVDVKNSQFLYNSGTTLNSYGFLTFQTTNVTSIEMM